MRPVSDDLLLSIAEVSAALVGLFFVGIFFYVETGFRRAARTVNVLEPYFHASTRIVLVLYSIPIGVSLTLVALEPAWSRWLFALLSLALIAANVDTVRRMLPVLAVTNSNVLVLNEALGTLAVLVLVVLPWALGGLHPSREDLTWSVLLAFGSGLLSIYTLVLSAFAIARFDAEVVEDSDTPGGT
jgi:hypothetical protein